MKVEDLDGSDSIMSYWRVNLWFSIRVCELEVIHPYEDGGFNQYSLEHQEWLKLAEVYNRLYGVKLPEFGYEARGIEEFR